MKTSITIGAVMLMLAFGFIIISYDRADEGIKILNDDDFKYTDTNYEGLFRLGLAPSTASRQPRTNDIDTGVRLTNGIETYSLIQSRTFVTKDYGKTFLARVE